MKALAIASVLVGACAADPVDTDDPDPVLTDEDRAALSELRYAPAPAIDPSNAYVANTAAQQLGQRLFFETGFSGPLLDRDNDGSTGTLGRVGEAGHVACASCHAPDASFVDTRSPHRQISLAAQWTTRRTPTLLDVAAHAQFNWDGRRDTMWNQALGVMESAREFNGSRLFVAQQIARLHRTEYETVFGAMPALGSPDLAPEHAGCEGITETATCHGKPGAADYDALAESERDAVTRIAVNAGKALAAYVTQLRCGEGRFDAWLDGDASALTRAEQRGAQLFVGRAGCATCHTGPQLTDGAFHNVGLRPSTVATAFTDTDDRGAAVGIAAAHGDPLGADGVYSDGSRGALPAVSEDLEGAFKTPTLRCIANQPSFMHTAQIRTIADVVQFFDRGGDGAGFPGTSELVPLDLSERERADLTAFLATLQGPGPDAELLVTPP